MTTSRERVIRTLNHEPVDRTPRDLWASPSTETSRGDELDEMVGLAEKGIRELMKLQEEALNA